MGLLDGLLGAGIGVGASLFGESKGIGKNKYQAQNFGQSNQYNPNAFNYGGTPDGATQAADHYLTQSALAEQRGGPQVNYSDANLYQGLGYGDRTGQQAAAGLMMQRATGQAPSIAGMQAQRDAANLQAAQQSAAAGARGPAAMALAQQQAAQNTAYGQANISGQAQINAANERMQAEQAAFGAYNGLRGSDLASQQQAAQQGQYQAGLNMQQRGLNDQYSLGNEQLANSVRQAQLNAGVQGQGILSNSQAQANALNSGIAGANAGVDKNYLDSAVAAVNGGLKSAMTTGPGVPTPQSATGGGAPDSGGAGLTTAGGGNGAIGNFAHGGPVARGQVSIMGERGPELVVPMGLMGMPARAAGGPMSSGQPYLVGERGPEMVVPQQNAVVIPAPQTAGLLARAQRQQEMNAQADAILGLMAQRGGR